jgi:hypothetical protein
MERSERMERGLQSASSPGWMTPVSYAKRVVQGKRVRNDHGRVVSENSIGRGSGGPEARTLFGESVKISEPRDLGCYHFRRC